MGIDAVLVVEAPEPFSPERLQAVGAALEAKFPDTFWIGERSEFGVLQSYDAGPNFAEVSWMLRFYAPGYERGPILTILAVAEFLADQVPGGRLFYGGDTNCDLPPELTPDRVRELREHAKTFKHEPH